MFVNLFHSIVSLHHSKNVTVFRIFRVYLRNGRVNNCEVRTTSSARQELWKREPLPSGNVLAANAPPLCCCGGSCGPASMLVTRDTTANYCQETKGPPWLAFKARLKTIYSDTSNIYAFCFSMFDNVMWSDIWRFKIFKN